MATPPTRIPWTRRLVAAPWLLVFVPASAASSAFGVALPLLILFTLHAGVVEVALATTLYNSALIPAAFLWGIVCDRLQWRAPLVLLNYAGFSVVFLVLALNLSLPTLLLAYAAYGLVAPSSAAASNLLILERFPPQDRPTAYASFQELSTLGGVAGILVGFTWVILHPEPSALPGLLYLTLGLALASALGVLLFVHDPPRRLSRQAILRHPESLVTRLIGSIPFFPRRLGPGFWARASRWLRQEATHEIPLILVAVFLFNTASNLFNTSYVPYLQAIGLTSAAIFLVNLSNNGAQVLIYPFSGPACQRDGGERAVIGATGVRAIGYAATGLLAILPLVWFSGGAALGANLVIFGVLGGAVALYGTASSLLLFRSMQRQRAGGLLGFNSALGGLAAVLGAAASGVVSVHFGFATTFLLSLGVMAISVPVWVAARRAWRTQHPQGVKETFYPSDP